MSKEKQNFGGKWTTEKLLLLEKYLKAYSKIMNNTKFNFAFIDAFAGTGYFKEVSTNQCSLLMPEFGVEEKQFLEGSTRIALGVDPPFQKYIFIEKEKYRCDESNKIKSKFPDKEPKIEIVHDEANKFLCEICSKNWSKHRAVAFLDPFGMQIKWSTLEAIAHTEAIDLWFLFHLGQAVNRLLKRDGKINEANKVRLNEIFGTDDWYKKFYTVITENNLFDGEYEKIQKKADFQTITSYFTERLSTIFPAVVSSPKPLLNSVNNPLFLLCFAAGNKKGAPTALKIANSILRTN